MGELGFLRYTYDHSVFLFIRNLSLYVHLVNYFKHVIFGYFSSGLKILLTYPIAARGIVVSISLTGFGVYPLLRERLGLGSLRVGACCLYFLSML